MSDSHNAIVAGVVVDQTAKIRQEGLTTAATAALGHKLSVTFWALGVLLIFGLVVTIAEVRAHYAAALLWALASLVVGIIGGFLFAIPRVPRSSISAKDPANTSTTSEMSSQSGIGADGGFGLGINTNLEEISDWLTKILVGVGLMQLRILPDAVRGIGYYVGQGLGANLETVASGIVIYFLGLGFLGGYLLTRMFVGPAFRLADQATRSGLEERIEQTRALAVALQDNSVINSDIGTAVGELNKPDKPPARIEQLIVTLREHLKTAPLHRKLNITLARLYAEGQRNFDESIRLLYEFIDNKKSAKQEKDRDTADAFFNIACYYSQKLEGKSGDIRNEIEDRGINAIKKSLDILPQNAYDVAVDKDLVELLKSSRLQELLQKVKSKVPKPGEDKPEPINTAPEIRPEKA